MFVMFAVIIRLGIYRGPQTDHDPMVGLEKIIMGREFKV